MKLEKYLYLKRYSSKSAQYKELKLSTPLGLFASEVFTILQEGDYASAQKLINEYHDIELGVKRRDVRNIN